MKRITLLLVSFGLVACGIGSPPDTNSAGLTFVHLNDTYRVGAVEDGAAGGFGRVVTVVRALQAQGRDVRILHGGDFLYPSLESQLWNGLQMVDALNFIDELAPVYATAGNHEFDRHSPEHLINAVRESRFEWLGDNYQFNTGDDAVDNALRSAFTFESNGKIIGIFSLTLHPDDGGTDRAYVPIAKNYREIAEQVIRVFEDASVDAIIGLTHLHMWQDIEIANLREHHPTFVFIAGGHDHEPQFGPLSDQSAAVMKGASNARVIWTIDLEFDSAGLPVISPNRLELNEDVSPDKQYLVLENKWRSQLLEVFPFLEARVGVAALAMDVREETVRTEETSWGNFITDQMRGAFGKPEAELAFINSGTLRIDDFIKGDILFEDIGRTFGFSSFLRVTTVTGAEFRVLMENGYRGSGSSQGYFPQLSGFRVCVDRSRDPGERIVSLQVPAADGWLEIGADIEYSLVVPDFIFDGGDGYRIPKHRPVSRPASELKYLVLDAVLALQAQGEKVGTAVDPENPRYVELSADKDRCFPL